MSAASCGGEMDVEGVSFDCTFPERLVRDLDMSAAIFMSKDMTAGSPSAEMAAPGLELGFSFQRPLLPFRSSSQRRHQSPTFRPRLASLTTDESHPYLRLPGDGRQPALAGESPASSSVTSAGLEPPSIRTRQQSAATAATSLFGGRCSSLLSHAAPLPSTPALSPCSSSNRESSPHGTWFEAEPESPQEPGGSIFTYKTSISDPHRPCSHSEDLDSMAESKNSETGKAAILAGSTTYFSQGCDRSNSRPHTPAGRLQLERPRIVDIPPTLSALKCIHSAASSEYGRDSASLASETWATAAAAQEPVGERPQQESYGAGRREGPFSSAPLLATANGRTVIDASAPPPISLGDKNRFFRHTRLRSHPSTAIGQGSIFEDEDVADDQAYADALTEVRRASLTNIHRRADASAGTLASPKLSTSYAQSAFCPGIPLPPEVIESLRVSISCFPETMLLTSSLSVETIRTYAKKLRYRADLERQARSTDTDSSGPLSPHHPKASTRRWNVGWLVQGRRGSKQHETQLLPQQHFDSILKKQATLPPSLSNLSITTETPVAPCWAPLKNIFPDASDYLCDALYAHLLVYNYITSLCGAPPPTARCRSPVRHKPPPPGSHGDRSNDGLRVPHKAASVLGMDDTVTAVTAVYHCHEQQLQDQQQQLLHKHRGRRPRGDLTRASSTTRTSPSTTSTTAYSWGPTTSGASPSNSNGNGNGNGNGTGTRTPKEPLPTSSTTQPLPRRLGSRAGLAPHNHHRNQQLQHQQDASASVAASLREIHGGLTRCVDMLVATLGRTAYGGVGDRIAGAAENDGICYNDGVGGSRNDHYHDHHDTDEVSLFSGLGSERAGKGSLAEGAEPVLVRALCEVVRCAEERFVGGL